MAFKVYKKNDYLIIQDTVTNKEYEGLLKDVVISRDLTTSTLFYFKNLNEDGLEGIDFADIISSTGSPYASLDAFINYYTATNTTTSSGGGSGSGATTSVEEIYYVVTTAFTGASVGDIILDRQIVNLSDGSIASEVWTNLTTGLVLSTPPASSKITAQSASPLTNAQLTAQGLAKETTLAALKALEDDTYGSGSVTSSTPSQFLAEGKGTVTFQVTGTWAGSIIVEYSPDGTNWYPTTYVSISTGNTATTFSANTGGQINTVGFDYVRLRSNTITSGTANVTWYGSRQVSNVMLDNPLPAGSNTIGKVQVDALTNGTQKGQIVDASGNVITSTTINAKQRLDVNLASAAAPNATAPTIGDMVGGTDGTNFKPLLMDSVGNLKVNTAATTFTYSANNSTSASGATTSFALANGSTWNGTIENAINQPYLITGIVSNQNVTLTVAQFLDAAGTIADVPAKTFTITAGTPFSTSVAILGNYVKLSVNNASGSAATIYVDSYYGSLPVQPDSLTQAGNFKTAIQEALPAGSNIIGKTSSDNSTYGTTNSVYVGGTSQVQVTPTVTSASAYTAGNVVGGLLTFANVVNSTVLSGVLESISIAVKSTQTASFKLYVFKGTPSTTFTDKTAPAIVTADAVNLLDVYSFTTPDNGLGSNVTLYYSDAINRSLVLTNTNLYAVLVTLGTPTFTTTTDVVVTASILRD